MGRACHSGRKVGPRAVPANFPKGPVPAPRGSPSTRARCLWRLGWAARRRRWPGGFQECAVGVGAFRTSIPTLLCLTKGSNGILSRQCRLRTYLKVKTFYILFSHQSSMFLKQNLEFGRDGPTLGLQIHTFISPSVLVSSLPPHLPSRVNHILGQARSFVRWAPPDCLYVYFLMCSYLI